VSEIVSSFSATPTFDGLITSRFFVLKLDVADPMTGPMTFCEREPMELLGGRRASNDCAHFGGFRPNPSAQLSSMHAIALTIQAVP